MGGIQLLDRQKSLAVGVGNNLASSNAQSHPVLCTLLRVQGRTTEGSVN